MSTRSLGVLTLDLILKMGGFKQGADKATREFDQMSKKLQNTSSKLMGGLKTLGVGIVGGLGLNAIIQATASAEKALAELDAAVKATGGAAGRSTQQLADMSSQLQGISIFGDEAIQDMQSLLLRFTSIQGVNFDRATAAVVDLSSALGKDLSTTALALGRALEVPDEGLRKLARTGVIFSASQERIVEDLVASGKTAEAQSFILDELEKKFAGAAEAARNNFGGALTGLKNAFGDLLEAKSGLPAVVEKIEALTSTLADPSTKKAADSALSGLVAAGTALLAVLTPILALFGKMVQTVGDLGARIDIAFGNLDVVDDATLRRLTTTSGKIDDLRLRRDRLLTDIPKGGFFNFANIAELKYVEGQLEKLAVLQNQIGTGRGPQSRGGPRRNTETQVQTVTEEDLNDADKILEALKTSQEKYNEEVKRYGELRKKNLITEEEYGRAIAKAREGLNKGGKSGLSDAAKEAEAARKKIDDLITGLQDQAAVFGLSEQAAFKYSVTQGALAKEFDKLGAAAGPLREQLLALSGEQSTREASAAIEEQIKLLNEQTATLGLSEEEAFQYSIAQGELAEQLLATGTASDELKARLEAANAGLTEARRLLELRAEGESVFESTRTDAENYAASLKRLNELLSSGELQGGQDTYNRAVADTVIEYVDAETAAKAYAERIKELNRLKAEGTLGEEAYQAAISKAQEVFAEAGREAAKVFVDQAKRNTQDILAEFLTDPFSRGLDGLVEDFDSTFKRIAAQAVAARIADALFSGFDAWISKIGSAFSGMGSGGAGGGWLSTIASVGSSFLGGGSSTSGLSEIAITAKRIPGYAEGGFTGDAPVSRPVGVVHGKEYVMPAGRVMEPGALSFLEAFHQYGMASLRGYATGGLVAGGTSVAVQRTSAAVRPVTSAPLSGMNVSQQFLIDAPNGTVSRQTQQQIAAAAAKGIAQANRRNN